MFQNRHAWPLYHRKMQWLITMSVVSLFTFSLEVQAANSTCPAPPTRPAELQPHPALSTRTLDPYSIRQTVTDYYNVPLGLGFLKPVEQGNDYYYDWMFEIELPAWYTPDTARPLGWLQQGMVYTETGVETLTGAGMVETAYEQTSFIIWETQGDWLKISFNSGLDAWTHRCHLKTAKLNLEPVTWQTFLRQHADWLHFRKPVPHMLRASASVDGELVTRIGLDHKIELIDIRGDWMEVEVEQPDLTCSGSEVEEKQVSKHHGWIKWRDQRGPWVYVYTRGC